MSLRVCLECRTAYADGLAACPQCGADTRDAVYDWESDVVKELGAQEPSEPVKVIKKTAPKAKE